MFKPLAPYPAALVTAEKKRLMVIGDLHIGWEMALSEQGIHVPSQMPKLLAKLQALVSTYKPETLLILGDLKYSVAKADMGEWHDVPDFFEGLRDRVKEIYVVRGNHDGNIEPLLPGNVTILPSTGFVFGEFGFFHGHRWPSPELLKCETLVMGHVHPIVVFRDPAGFRITRQVWVKAPCNGLELAHILRQKYRVKPDKPGTERRKPKVKQLFIVPSFNEFLGGRPLNDRIPKKPVVVGPVLRSSVVDLEEAEVFLLDGTLLGTLRQLRMVGWA
jgi:putative SbcD/Mre11-related phosphoesterase